MCLYVLFLLFVANLLLTLLLCFPSTFFDYLYCFSFLISPDAKGVDQPVFQLEGHIEYVHNLAETNDMRFLSADLALFCKRHRRGVDLAKIDEMIRQKFMKQMTAVMFEIDFTEIEATEGAEAGLAQKFHAQEMLGPILQKHNAIPLEDVLHVFEDPCDAVRACVAMRNKIRQYNNGQGEDSKLHLTG